MTDLAVRPRRQITSQTAGHVSAIAENMERAGNTISPWENKILRHATAAEMEDLAKRLEDPRVVAQLRTELQDTARNLRKPRRAGI